MKYSNCLPVFFLSFAVLIVGCTNTDKDLVKKLSNNYMPKSEGPHYTLRAAMSIYGYQPERAYSSLGEHGNMLEAFTKIELGVRDITAREHIARYNALQQQMEAERQKSLIARANMAVAAAAVLALLFFVFAIVVIFKNRAINRKNHLLAQKIADAIKYKKMYLEEKGTQAPLVAPDIETASDEQLFQYINEVILREQLFLDPKFERQTIMDRFQLTKERAGAVFSKGSDHSKLTSYIQQLRLEYAAKLLVEQPDKNIVQIAADSGFSSSTYFSDRFRQHFGLSPTDFRRNAMSQVGAV